MLIFIKTFKDCKKAFEDLIDSLSPETTIIAFADSPELMSLLKDFPKQRLITYGLQAGDYRVKNLDYFQNREHFSVEFQDKK